MAVTRKQTNRVKGKKRTKKATMKGGEKKEKKSLWARWRGKSKNSTASNTGMKATEVPTWNSGNNANNSNGNNQTTHIGKHRKKSMRKKFEGGPLEVSRPIIINNGSPRGRFPGRSLPAPPINNMKFTTDFGKFSIPVIKEDPIYIDKLGSGQFGTTYKGSISKCALDTKKNKESIAYKKVLPKLKKNNEKARKEFEHEAKMHWLVSGPYYHENVVKIFGIGRCGGGRLECIMMEFCDLGSLEGLLRNSKNREKYSSNNEFLFSTAKQIANGILFIHSKNIAHLDLAVRNVFLNNARKAKIGDFGMSQILYADRSKNKLPGGIWPVKYYNPDMINYGQYGKRTDFWSYGILLWELYNNGMVPYGDLDNNEVVKMVTNGKYIEQNGCPDVIYSVMLASKEQKQHRNPMKLIKTIKTPPIKRESEAVGSYRIDYKDKKRVRQLRKNEEAESLRLAEEARKQAELSRKRENRTDNRPFGAPPPPPPRKREQSQIIKANPFNNGNNGE